MSTITRQSTGTYRPSWLYPTAGSADVQQLEMLESIRNACEQIRDEIRGIRQCGRVHGAFGDLAKIARNTTKAKRKRSK